MSGLLTGLVATSLPSFLGLDDALFTPVRSIGTIIPDVTIEEVHRDELEITQHPVERGSPITDHSFMRPLELSVRVGWSNSGRGPSYITDVYSALQDLQQSGQPFSVTTGKRSYDNMLIASLIQTTNAQTGDYALIVQALLREVILVDTQAATVPASSVPSKTGDIPGAKSESPKSVSSATNSTLNTESAPFNNVGAMQLGSNSAYPQTMGVVPLLGGA